MTSRIRLRAKHRGAVSLIVLVACFVVLVPRTQARAQNAFCEFDKVISARDHAQLEGLLRGGCDPNAAPDGEPGPLWLTFNAGDVEAMRLLLDHGANPNQRNAVGETILHSLTDEEGDFLLGKLLLSKGATIDAQNNEGETPLIAALGARTGTEWPGCSSEFVTYQNPRCWKPNVRLIRFLLAHKARPDIANRYGATPLHLAAAEGLTDAARLLIERGSDVQRKDNNGWTPLYLAVRAANEETVRRLLARGADPNIRDDEGDTPLHAAALRAKRQRMPETKAELRIVRLLLAKGARAKQRNLEGFTALHMAARADAPAIAQILIDAGADDGGAGPLHHAALKGHLRMVAFLLNRGANVNRKDERGFTPLHWYCRFPHRRYPAMGENLKTLGLLVERGGRLEMPDANGRVPLYHCVSRGNSVSVRFLLARGARPDAVSRRGVTPLHLAAYQDDLEMFEILREAGAKLDARDGQGRTARDWAAISPSCDKKVARLLEKAGAPGSGRPAVDACPPPVTSCTQSGVTDQDGRTPLHLATSCRDADTARALLAAGAQPNARDRWGRTPLHLLGEGVSDEYSSVKMAEILLEARADLASRDVHGRTPLHAAADSSDEEPQRVLADFFLCRGADPSVIDQFGLTASDIASIRGWGDSDLVKCKNGRWKSILRQDTKEHPAEMY